MPCYQILPQAACDLDECAEYIAKDNHTVALKLYDAAEESYRMLMTQPRLGAQYPSQNPLLSDIRFFPIQGFRKYLVFYRSVDNGIEIIRVLGTSRNIKNILL